MGRTRSEVEESALWFVTELGAILDSFGGEFPIDNHAINKYLCDLLLTTRNELTFYREFENQNGNSRKSVTKPAVSVEFKQTRDSLLNKPMKKLYKKPKCKGKRRKYIGIGKLIIPLLEQNKAPMRALSIKRKLEEIHDREFAENSIYSALNRSDKIYKVGDGTWGLLRRDF